jgi:hypothetical protein
LPTFSGLKRVERFGFSLDAKSTAKPHDSPTGLEITELVKLWGDHHGARFINETPFCVFFRRTDRDGGKAIMKITCHRKTGLDHELAK